MNRNYLAEAEAARQRDLERAMTAASIDVARMIDARLCRARTVRVDGFEYATTAPERPATRLPVAHYVDLATDAAFGTDTECGTVAR